MKSVGLAAMLSVALTTTLAFGGDGAPAGSPPAPVLSEAQRDFMTWRFGMFVHFNLGTMADLDWAGGYEDPALFHPTKLDCGQWADSAKAAGMSPRNAVTRPSMRAASKSHAISAAAAAPV